MREYGRIAPGFWIGKTGKAIKAMGPLHQVAALYLVTSPHANMCGLYYLPKLYMHHESGLPLDELDGLLEGLRKVGFATYDDESEMVFVHRMAEYQLGGKLDPLDNRVKGLLKQYKALPKGLLSPLFEDQYSDIFPKKEKPLVSPSQALTKQLTGKARQGKELEPSGSLSPEADDAPKKSQSLPECPHREIVAMYHELFPGLPKVRDWHAGRQKLLRSRWSESQERQHVSWWRDEFFSLAAKSPHLLGENDRSWRADLQWMLERKNFTKILEGFYREDKGGGGVDGLDVETLVRAAVKSDRRQTGDVSLDEACRLVGWTRLMGADDFNRKPLMAEVKTKYLEVCRG